MPKTRIEELYDAGQSVWLDSISRSMIETGYLKKMIDTGLKGMTSNPTIFDRAISSGADYDKKIRELHKTGRSAFEIYDELTVRDIQDAADIFGTVYKKTAGADGYVSLEINPKLAGRTHETIEEGKRLYEKVNRHNVMFKVPSTDEGFGAVEELLSEGINVNVTLIFSLQQYVKTAWAFMRGLKRFLEKGGDVSRVASVASVFVSRIDTAVDGLLDKKIADEKNRGATTKLNALRGKAAVANSGIIFRKYRELFSSVEFQELKENGAMVQRVLWGSTGTKDPAYSDIKYVTELIGKHTVNTLPENTLNAFLDHGIVKEALTEDAGGAGEVLGSLRDSGIDVDAICDRLLAEGVVAFEKSFDSLLRTIGTKAGS